MRALVCGSRDYDDVEKLQNTLDAVHENYHIDTVVEGEAPGADTLAREWAEAHGVTIEAYAANWKEFGRAAGPIRNKQMLVEGQPDIVYAFTNKPLSESRGTRNMVTQARKAGIRTVVIGEDDTEWIKAGVK